MGGWSEVDPGLQLNSSVLDEVSEQTCRLEWWAEDTWANGFANSVLVGGGEWRSSQTLGQQAGGEL